MENAICTIQKKMTGTKYILTCVKVPLPTIEVTLCGHFTDESAINEAESMVNALTEAPKNNKITTCA